MACKFLIIHKFLDIIYGLLRNDMQFYGLRGEVNGSKPYEKLVKYESRTVKLN